MGARIDGVATGTMTLWEKTDADPELTFEVAVTLADQLAFNRHVFSLPAWRRAQTNLVVAYGTATPLVALTVCTALMLLFQQSGVDLDEALGESGRGKLYLAVLASLVAAEIFAALTVFWRRRLSLEASVRAILALRPSINPADPALTERYAIAIHAMGFRISSDSAAHAYAWTVLKRFDETADHFFLMIEPRFGFIVPKRELAPATTLALRQTMQDFHAATARVGSPR